MTAIEFHDTGVKIRDLETIKFTDIKKLTWKMSFFQQTQSVNLVLKNKKTIQVKEYSMFNPSPYFDMEIIKLVNVLNNHDIPTMKFARSSAAEFQKSIVILIAIVICVEMFFKSSLFKW